MFLFNLFADYFSSFSKQLMFGIFISILIFKNFQNLHYVIFFMVQLWRPGKFYKKKEKIRYTARFPIFKTGYHNIELQKEKKECMHVYN